MNPEASNIHAVIRTEVQCCTIKSEHNKRLGEILHLTFTLNDIPKARLKAERRRRRMPMIANCC